MTGDTGDLFAAPPPRPRKVIVRARRADPATSHEAAAAFEADQTKAQRSVTTVVCILRARGPMTDFQIREAWSEFWGTDAWSYTLPCKARHWARQAGYVRQVGKSKHQGRNVILWGVGTDSDFLRPPQRCSCCGQTIKTKDGHG